MKKTLKPCSLRDRGLAGDKMFVETLRFDDGEVRDFEAHLSRLSLTMHDFHATKPDTSVIMSHLGTIPSKGIFKVRIVYASDILRIETIPYKPLLRRSISLVCADNISYSHKYYDRHAITDLQIRSGCDDIIMLNDGNVSDSAVANLVFESDEGLFTPDTPMLRGIAISKLLRERRVCQRRITVDSLCQYRLVHFVNTMCTIGELPPFPLGDIRPPMDVLRQNI